MSHVTKAPVAANLQQAVPLYGVHRMDESLRFYVDGLGFAVKHEWIDEGVLRWCWLDRDGVAVMLQEFRREGVNKFVPEGKVGIGVSMNFTCRDALALYHEFVGRGLTTKRPFVGNNMWVVSLTDPDGYSLHFESATDVPEETEYDG